jgi:hypothetical protein
MEYFSIRWLAILGAAAAWTTFFSLFNTPGIRGYRNLGILACFVLAFVMLFFVPFRSALVTWASIGWLSGMLYSAYEWWSYFSTKDKSEATRPSVSTIFNGLLLWPIMLPEFVEYTLAGLGLLKTPLALSPVAPLHPASDPSRSPGPRLTSNPSAWAAKPTRRIA